MSFWRAGFLKNVAVSPLVNSQTKSEHVVFACVIATYVFTRACTIHSHPVSICRMYSHAFSSVRLTHWVLSTFMFRCITCIIQSQSVNTFENLAHNRCLRAPISRISISIPLIGPWPPHFVSYKCQNADIITSYYIVMNIVLSNHERWYFAIQFFH